MNVLYVENLVKHYRGKRVVNGVSLFYKVAMSWAF